MAITPDAKKISDALLSFALEGHFPNDISSLPPVSGTDLEPAIQALDKAKRDLEVRHVLRRSQGNELQN
jgi:centromere/kinetochore protein ZW10